MTRCEQNSSSAIPCTPGRDLRTACWASALSSPLVRSCAWVCSATHFAPITLSWAVAIWYREALIALASQQVECSGRIGLLYLMKPG